MPLIQESTYVRQKSRSFLKRYFDGDMSRMLSACLDEETLTKNEIDTLREILAKHEK